MSFVKRGFGEVQVAPMVLDLAMDFREDGLYMRADIDHKVLLPEGQALWVNTVTGQLKTERDDWTPPEE